LGILLLVCGLLIDAPFWGNPGGRLLLLCMEHEDANNMESYIICDYRENLEGKERAYV
jgi:hypothetical protein